MSWFCKEPKGRYESMSEAELESYIKKQVMLEADIKFREWKVNCSEHGQSYNKLVLEIQAARGTISTLNSTVMNLQNILRSIR